MGFRGARHVHDLSLKSWNWKGSPPPEGDLLGTSSPASWMGEGDPTQNAPPFPSSREQTPDPASLPACCSCRAELR